MARPMLRKTLNSTPPSNHERIPRAILEDRGVMPYVSVVIPAYNAAQFIADAYRSLVDQTIDDWEVIFVNDGSQDATLSTIRSLAANEPRVKVIDLPSNSGPARARNMAIAIADGDWIAMLDADDWYSRGRLAVLIRAAERTGADVVLDNQFVVDPISRRVSFLAFEPPTDEVMILKFTDYLLNIQSNTVLDFGYLKPIIRRRWLTANGIKYQENLRLGEDRMLLLECYARRAKVILVSKPYYYYNFQYSHISRTASPTTRTEASKDPLLVATEQFLDKHRPTLSRLERRLITSACGAVREAIIFTQFRDCVRHYDIIGVACCLRHPIRLFRGIYFAKRRNVLFMRHIRAFSQIQEDLISDQDG
jgi:succinoglycan biosynthesis protein ExoO